MDSPEPQPAPAHFAPTRWTLVLRARGESPEARKALGELCEAYYLAVFRFLRREGRNEDQARDLTQEFFARVLGRGGFEGVEPGRGRFRSFLLGAVKHFLADLRDHERAAKRGGGQSTVPLPAGSDTSSEVPIPDPNAQVPDALFDREWAVTLVARALASLEAECAGEGKQAQFETLKPWLVGEVSTFSQADAARQLGCSEGAIRVTVHRLRRRFRELVRAEISQTVNDASLVQEELGYLLEVLSRG